MSSSLLNHLGLAGEMLADERGLSSAQRLCNEIGCLRTIGQEHHDAKLLVAAQVQPSGTADYDLAVAVFETASGRLWQQSKSCLTCQPEQLGQRLNDLSDRVLQELRSQRGAGARAATVPRPLLASADGSLPSAATAEATPAASTASGTPAQEPRFATWQKVTASVLGASALVSLSTGITLHVIDGSPSTCAPPDGQFPKFPPIDEAPCTLRTMGGAIAGYTLAGVFLVGVAVTLGWPKHKQQMRK